MVKRIIRHSDGVKCLSPGKLCPSLSLSSSLVICLYKKYECSGRVALFTSKINFYGKLNWHFFFPRVGKMMSEAEAKQSAEQVSTTKSELKRRDMNRKEYMKSVKFSCSQTRCLKPKRILLVGFIEGKLRKWESNCGEKH